MPAADQTFISLADLLRTCAVRRPSEASSGAASPQLASALTVDAATRCDLVSDEASTPDDLSAHGDGDASAERENAGPQTTVEISHANEPRCRCSAGPEETRSAIRDARLFGAALADVFDRLSARLTRGLAEAVLARELQLAPPQIATIANRLIAESLAEEPLRLRVAPGDADVQCSLPVIVDSALEPGDAVLDCRSGSIDARLPVRLALVCAEMNA